MIVRLNAKKNDDSMVHFPLQYIEKSYILSLMSTEFSLYYPNTVLFICVKKPFYGRTGVFTIFYRYANRKKNDKYNTMKHLKEKK